jgi:predicted enzyme related to lactoylglutathione lyase
MPLPEGMTQPFWLGYVGVADADASVAKLEKAGAKIHKRMEIPDAGKIALVTDRQGAGFAILQRSSDQPSEAFDQNAPGHGNWHELHTSDWQDAFDFYSGQFGWTKDQAVPMGPDCTYQLFAIEGRQAGGMFNDPQAPRPHWLYYFGVEDIDRAAKRVTGNAGSIVQGPLEVPGGAWIVQATDPQGAKFALVGPRK